MRIGFTGTQQGMTEDQKTAVREFLVDFVSAEFHHGDCVGADAEAHAIALALGADIVIHPPEVGAKRAFLPASAYRDAKPYLLRNQDIVDETEILLATPKGMTEERRSGTWATVRYARRTGRPLYIVFPDGSARTEGM